MPIRSFELSSIEGKKFTKPGEKLVEVRIESNSTVTLISELNSKEANVDFRFTVSYVGKALIKIEGTLVFEGDAPTLASQWATKGNMPDEVAHEIHTAVMMNCISEAVLLAKDLHLPPPIPPPAIPMPQKRPGKPSSSSEVA